MKPTPEQEAAITITGQALLVEAGAGTGKTWVLVQRFLHLLDRYPHWPLDSIVAVTFTEKATREMRSRIRRAITEKVTRETPPDSHWRQRLGELERLQISTIHGLCGRILRENAIAAGVDPYFEVLDEQDADLLKGEAIRQALAELVEQESPTLALLESLRIWDLQSELANLLNQRGTVQRLFDDLPAPTDLLARWRAEIAAMREQIWARRLQEDEWLQEALREMPAMPIADPADGLAGAVRLASEGCRLVAEDLAAAAANWLGIKLTGGRPASWEDKAALKSMLKALRDAAQTLQKAGTLQDLGPSDEAVAEMLQLWRDLWRHLLDTYDRLKEDRQALDFDDLELRARDLLAQTPRPHRLDDYLAGINHLMVDEFQDTNITQKEIVYALAHPADGGRLFVVGDAKQSIYRFRQAQVAVFNRTAQDIERQTGCPALPLSRSFRTHGALVPALNDLFDQILLPLGADYAPYEARPGPLSAQRPAPPPQPVAPAPVEMILLPKKDPAGQAVSAEDGRLWEAQHLAQRLWELQRQAFPVWDKGQQAYRPFQFGDAAILFRATTNLPLYEEEFKKAGLPYLTVSGRGYYDRPEVRDLIALLNCLYAPGDDLNLAAALRSPLFSLSDETLYRLRWHAPGGGRAEAAIPYRDALRDPPPNAQPEEVAFAWQTLADLWARAGRVDVWQLLRRAIDATGYEATLILADASLEGAGRRYANVTKFLALARDRGEASLSDFLRRLEDLQAREAREGEALAAADDGRGGAGAVQLMSIHAAKGLEFPVVVVADLGRSNRGGFGLPRIRHDPAYGLVCMNRDEDGDWQKPASYAWARWLDSLMEEAESKRLLYVACTRAADLLLLSGRTGPSSTWLANLQSVWDIPAEGDAESTLDFGDYSLRVVRLKDRPEQQPVAESAAEAEQVLGPAVPEMPALAGALAADLPRPPAAVTSLIRPRDAADRLRRVTGFEGRERLAARAPGWLVGNVVHRALAHWTCLAWPQDALWNLLGDYARREGLTRPDERQNAVVRARHMLRQLKASPLYQDIETGRRREAEVPFTVTGHRVLHGVIDLLYQDRQGRWQLLDWKTEAPKTEEQEEYRRQLAVYALAAERILGQRPRAALVFLQPEVFRKDFSSEELIALAQRMLDGDQGSA